MTVILVSGTLWLIVAILTLLALRRDRALAISGWKDGLGQFLAMIPRLMVGFIGAGYMAEALPQDLIAAWLGPDSSLTGLVIAAVAGMITPGGPVIGFAVAAVAMKAGAGMPQLVAYATAWALLAMHRVLLWETPVMPKKLVLMRVGLSLPLPFIAAAITILAGRP